MRGKLFRRGIAARVKDALADTHVVAVVGPRQAGKTTLVQDIARRRRGATFVTFDDPATLEAARRDPRSFVNGRTGLLVIDEVQRLPELMLPIKLNVDEDQRPGRFLLTGSSDLFAVRGLADTLAGRMEVVDLLPLTQGEIEGRLAPFTDALFRGDVPVNARSALSRADYIARACAGGLPEPLARPEGRRRTDWFDSYVRAVTDREVPNVAGLFRVGDLPRIMKFVGARHASVLNVADLARDAGVPEKTLHRYLDVLEAVYLIRRLRAWSPNLTSREARQPKVYIVDSGLAAHLRGANRSRLLRPEVALGAEGPILEGFVLGELVRQLTWAEERADVFHYRDRDGREVDIVLETYDGRVVGVEVKGSATVRSEDFRGLGFLRDRLGDRFVLGVVLHAGQVSLSFGDRLRALPMSALWRPLV